MTSPKRGVSLSVIIVVVALLALAGAYGASGASSGEGVSLAADMMAPRSESGPGAEEDPVAVCDVPSALRPTIQSAVNTPACDVINLTDTLYTENVVISRTVMIMGQADAPTIVDGNASGHVFHVWPGVTAELNDMTIRNGNEFYGGGILNQGTLTVSRCTLTGSHASRGGGIDNWGVLLVTDSTISGNYADWAGFQNYGGGIRNGSGAILVVLNSTITGNWADHGGGGIYNWIDSTSLALANSIIAGSLKSTDCYSFPTILSFGHNISSDDSCDLNNAGDKPNTDPMLGPLADNGGPTFTHALLPGSPAVDAGSCPDATADQRGFSRPIDLPGIANADDGCDIGAYERFRNVNLASIMVQAYMGPWELEPNDSFGQANRYLVPGHIYYGNVEAPVDDSNTNDFYSFYWSGTGTLHIDVKNYLKGQWVQVYSHQYGTPVWETLFNIPSFDIEIIAPPEWEPGTYTVRFYSNVGAPDPYNFSVYFE